MYWNALNQKKNSKGLESIVWLVWMRTVDKPAKENIFI